MIVQKYYKMTHRHHGLLIESLLSQIMKCQKVHNITFYSKTKKIFVKNEPISKYY